MGNGYRLGPEGLSFENPVTLTFHYNDELLDSRPAEFLWIVFQESDGSWKAMLKSALDTDAKTVSVETSHFSNWSAGVFVDLTLNPVQKEVRKGGTVELAIKGFSRGNTTDVDDLAALIPKEKLSEKEQLIARSYGEISMRAVEWTLNGVKSPVSNNNGSLRSTENTASYTAPANVPKPNVVAVSVELERASFNSHSTFYLTSKITIVENDLYIKVEFRGQTYIYYQYGFNDAEIEDPDHYSMSVCAFTENKLDLVGMTFVNNEITDVFEINFDNPSRGSRGLIGIGDGGGDDLDFMITNPSASYEMIEETRTRVEDRCIKETNESNHVTMNLTNYSGTSLSDVEGSFSGTLYYSDYSYDTDCKSSTPYPVSGSFHLVLLTQ